MTMKEAYAMLPAGAKWSCSFGYPGVEGFVEYYRNDGILWIVRNTPHDKDNWKYYEAWFQG